MSATSSARGAAKTSTISRLLVAIAALVAILVVGLVALLAFVDLNRFKPLIENAVEMRTGREFSIEGDIGWSLYPILGAELRGVTLGNAAGFDQPMAQVDRAALGIALLPLLEGRLQVSDVLLERPRLVLGIDASGRGNWEDLVERQAEPSPTAPAPAEESGEPTLAVAVDGIRITDGELEWIDTPAQQRLRVAPFNLRTGALALGQPTPVVLTLELASEVPALTARVEIDTVLTVNDSLSVIQWRELAASIEAQGESLPGGGAALALTGEGELDLDQQTMRMPAFALRMADLELTGQLEGKQVIDAPAFSASLQTTTFSPRELLLELGIEPPATTDPAALDRAAFAGRLTATPERVAFDELRVVLDDTTVQGNLAAQLAEPVSVGFALTLDAVDLDRYLPPDEPAAEPPAGAPSGGQPDGAAGGPAAPAEDPFGWMEGLEVAGTLRAQVLEVSDILFRDVAATIRLDDRVLSLDPLVAQLYGGEQRLKVSLDARQPEPATRLTLALQDLAIGDLLADLMEKAPLKGTAALSADLQVRGLDAEQIKRSLRGSGELRVRDGALLGFNVAQELRNALALFKGQPRTDAVAATDFTELALQFTADGGVVRWPSLNAQSPLLRLASKGSFDLAAETLHAQVDAGVVKSLKGQGGEPLNELAGFNIPVRLSGAIDAPRIKVDLKGVLAQTALGKRQQELEQKLDERKGELREKAREELQRGLKKLFR